MIKTLLLSVAAAALLTTAAAAAPLNATAVGPSATAPIEQVRMICDESGRCWRSRGPRYVQRGYDDGYVVRRGYNRPGYGYYGGGGGPSIGLGFGRGW
jgi:hypothetical protein